jgi:hypothetical protein
MDRDDHAQSLTLTPVEPTPFRAAFGRLPPSLKTEVLSLGQVMREIHEARKVLPACREIARRMSGRRGYSADNLSDKYYAWREALNEGGPDAAAATLIDHRRCLGCGVNGCTVARVVSIPQGVLERWKREDISNDKRGRAEAWKAIIRDLCEGRSVEDAGTWREVYHAENPYRPLPDRCPYSLHRPPTGWSLSNFSRHKVAKVIKALAQKGSFEAWRHLPQVRLDLTTLRPFEWLVVDDHRLDFKVFVDVPGQGVQLVELWGLFVMDVSTRMIVSFALKPRVQRADGSTMAFEHRDMQHLLAHVLGTYGVPADYTQTWIVENAAAAVSTDTERLIEFLSGGRVKIKRTGIQVGDMTLSGFPERWGNYRGKRWLEVWFAALDIICGGVKGQMGSDYWSKPGSFDARQAFGNRLAKLLDKCTPEVRAKLELPFEWAGEAHWLVSDAIELLNHRTDHRLEGFEQVRFFAFDPAAPVIPLHPQLALLHGCEKQLERFTKLDDELQGELLSYGGAPRCITPAEKMALMMPRMQRLSAEAVVDLQFDEVSTWKGEPLMWRGGDVLDIEIKRGREKVKVRFHGSVNGVEIGMRVIARLNTDRIECGVWLLNEKRQFLGWMAHDQAPTHDDLDGLHRQLGAQIKARNEAIGIVQRLTNNRRDASQKIGDMATLTQTINTLRGAEAKEAEDLPALPQSRDLAEAVARVRPAEEIDTDRRALRALRKAAKI